MNFKKIKTYLKKNANPIYWITFSAVILLLIVCQYYAPIKYSYIVPPGDDPYNHLSQINQILQGNANFLSLWRTGSYPPLFHYLIASISFITHISPLKVLVYFCPLIIILTSLSVYFLSYVSFGRYPALITFFLYSFGTGLPLQLYNDGGYPNLIAASIFLPLCIAFAVLYWRSRSKKHLTFCLLFGLLVILTHHISTFYLLVITFTSFPILLLFSYFLGKIKSKKILFFLLLYVLMILMFFVLYLFSDLLAPARKLAQAMIDIQASYPFIKIIPQPNSAIIPANQYDVVVGQSLFLPGIVGLFYSFVALRKKLSNFYFPLVVFSVWIIVLYFGSRATFLSDPNRLTRDLVVPLSLFGGFLCYDLYTRSKDKLIFFVIFVPLFFAWFYPGFLGRIKKFNDYEPQVRITQADIEAVNLINQSDKRTTILTNAQHPWLRYFLKHTVVAYNTNPDFNKIDDYDYIYIVKYLTGWVPAGQNSLLKELEDLRNYQLSGDFKSPTSEILLYKRIAN